MPNGTQLYRTKCAAGIFPPDSLESYAILYSTVRNGARWAAGTKPALNARKL